MAYLRLTARQRLGYLVKFCWCITIWNGHKLVWHLKMPSLNYITQTWGCLSLGIKSFWSQSWHVHKGGHFNWFFKRGPPHFKLWGGWRWISSGPCNTEGSMAEIRALRLVPLVFLLSGWPIVWHWVQYCGEKSLLEQRKETGYMTLGERRPFSEPPLPPA